MAPSKEGIQAEVADPPSDAISAISFAPEDPNRLLVSSWDKNIYLYEVNYDGDEPQGTLLQKFEHRAPILDVCFGASDNEAYTAGMDWHVKRVDLESGDQTTMSKHSQPVCHVVYCPGQSILVSASWDSTLHIHNTADPTQAPITINLPGKPHAIAASPTKLVVAMTARLVHIYDLPTVAKLLSSSTNGNGGAAKELTPWQQRESSLKFLTRAVSCMPNDAGFATSSIEGRVAVEWFEDTAESQARKYAFKCHRQTAPEDEGGGDIVYPVNALAFHPVHGTFASGGGDGTVSLWDAEAKRRMRHYSNLGNGVAALAFSCDGRYMAMGLCPPFETGQEDYSAEGQTKLIIRVLAEGEAKGKSAK